ncbi:MAG: acyltransferase [Clostridia bacterium]|nr:acyltransferase [Clostridia bacterium]
MRPTDSVGRLYIKQEILFGIVLKLWYNQNIIFLERYIMSIDTERNQNCAIDLAKYLFAILVVSIHLIGYAFANMAQDGAPPTGNSNPWMLFGFPLYYVFARSAVPFFFIASSYFLFRKIGQDSNSRKVIIRKYCIRLLKLYAFWFVVSVPIIVYRHFIAPEGDYAGGCGPLLFFVKLLTGGGVWWFLVFMCFNRFRSYCECCGEAFCSDKRMHGGCVLCRRVSLFKLLSVA